MKTIKTIHGEFTLSNEQFKICSAIVTKISDLPECIKNENDYFHSGILSGLKMAADFANVPSQILYDIEISKNIKGYQNMNKLSEVVYF